MKLDVSLPPVPLKSVPEIAREAEAIGFDALWSSETMHDPFLPGALIAEHTRSLRFGTAIAVAFGRSPATLAYTSWDLAQSSSGRFMLGLGTQVKAHVEKRFGMPWPESVVGMLREQIQAVRAFWHTWQTGEPLNFRGSYYKLTLMTPFFNPGPIPNPNIPIYVAGVNTGLAQLAGEAADGFLVHPFHTTEYLTQVLMPAIHLGLKNRGDLVRILPSRQPSLRLHPLKKTCSPAPRSDSTPLLLLIEPSWRSTAGTSPPILCLLLSVRVSGLSFPLRSAMKCFRLLRSFVLPESWELTCTNDTAAL